MNKKINMKNIIIVSLFTMYLTVLFLIQNSTLNLDPKLFSFVSTTKNIYLLLSIFFIVFFNKYKTKQLLIIGGIASVLLVTKFLAGSSPLLDLLLIVLGIKNIPLRTILKTIYFTQIFSSLLILFLYFTSQIPDRLIIRDGVLRSSLGFWHPNTAGLVLLSIFILSIFLEKKRSTLFFKILFFNSSSVVLYELTNSRTSMVLILAVTFITIGQSVFLKLRVSLFQYRLFVPIIFTLFLCLSVGATFLYVKGNFSVIKLSVLLSNRIAIGSRFFKEYGISLFGQPVMYNSFNFSTQEVVGSEYRVLDNVYLKYVINYGLSSTIFLCSYFYGISSKLNKKYLILWNMYMLIFLVYGFVEQSAFNYTTNFFLFFGVLLLNEEANKEFLL